MQFQAFLKKTPLRVIIIVPLVVLLLTTNLLLAMLAFNNSQTAVNDMASQLRNETTARVEQNLQEYVDIGSKITNLNADLLRQGLLNVTDTKTATHYFFQQASEFDGVSTIEFADPQGHLLGGNRAENYIVVANDSTNLAIQRFAVDENGYMTDKIIANKPNYDARTRDWYKSAVAAGKAVWTDISPSPIGARLDESAVLPVYDADNTFRGVFSVDVSLSRISEFLRGLKVGKTGQVFIMERSGAIVASSFDEPPYLVDKTDATKLNRLLATNSQQVLISQTAQFISQKFPQLTNISGSQEINFSINNERQFVQVTNFQHSGLDWLIMVVVPEKDFLAQIQAHNQTTALLILVGLGITLLLGILLATWITRPISEMNAAAKKLAAGDWNQKVDVNRGDEVGQLGQSFNDMAKQLREIFGTLEQRIADRTRDLGVAADVSRQVTQVLELDKLLPELVELTRIKFGLYGVAVFLADAKDNTLRLQAGTGGASSVNTQFKYEDPGLIPLSVRQRQPQVINDVSSSKDFAVNPAFPNTRSEAAFPLMIGSKAIGVLDLQSDQINKFKEAETQVLASLAAQIAIAVRNAQLFTDAQQARSEAEKANRVKSAFLASMSHELRTPLNSVINFTTFVAEGDMGEVNQEQIDILQEVISSGKHLLNLINDVLDMSKIEAGNLNLLVEDNVNVTDILKSMVMTSNSLLAKKPVELKLDVPANLPSIRADRQRILQVMLNIVSNACKFTKQGTITIQARQQDAEILISVKDTGPGIDAKDQHLVFEAFKQTDTGLRQGGGTGLGMPITKNLVEAHGGRIWIDSRMGEGTTFTIALPIKSDILVPTLVDFEAAK